jgi:hypothetical protein
MYSIQDQTNHLSSKFEVFLIKIMRKVSVLAEKRGEEFTLRIQAWNKDKNVECRANRSAKCIGLGLETLIIISEIGG